jgi:hypothetical protein
MHTEPAPSLLLPRGLILASSLWLIVSWLLCIGIKMPVQPSSDSFTPGVRLMMMSITVGLLIGWPMLRLSQRPSPFAVSAAFLDLMTLVMLVQIVIWPLRIVTNWPPIRVAAIDATLVGWMVIVGAVIASATGVTSRGPRLLGMAACLAICLGAPLLMWLGMADDTRWMQQVVSLSPLLAVRTMGEGGGAPPTFEQWRWVILLGVCGIAMWTVVGLSMSRPRATNPA